MAVDPTVNRGQTVMPVIMPAGSTSEAFVITAGRASPDAITLTIGAIPPGVSGAWPTPTQPPQNRYTEDYDFDPEAALMEACRLLRILNQLDNLPATTRVWFMGRQMREDDEVEAVRKRAETER